MVSIWFDNVYKVAFVQHAAFYHVALTWFRVVLDYIDSAGLSPVVIFCMIISFVLILHVC